MAAFNTSQLIGLLNKMPVYQSESVKNDLGRGLVDRAYQTLMGSLGGQYGNTINSIFTGLLNQGIMPIETNTNTAASDTTSMVQTSLSSKNKGAFKWVQENLTTDMFVSAESCFIAFGKPLYSANSSGTDFNLIGMCQDISISVGVNVMSFKELRADRNIILPLKSTPGNLSIRRLLTTSGTINSLVHGDTNWAYDTQKASTKNLFGILIAFMSPGRTKDIASVYAERCAITNMSIPINAGNFALSESINIIFDRLKDDVQVNDADMPGATNQFGTSLSEIAVMTGTNK